jgi:uncharacterized membrane protein YozB (DUF420 family)
MATHATEVRTNAVLGLAVVLSLYFLFVYALPYFVTFTSHVDEMYGVEFDYRASLLMHISGGTIAILFGPFQFFSGLRRRHMQLHRWTGYCYLFGVSMGVTASFYVAPVTPVGPSFGVALWGLGLAWLATTAMAIAAIYRRRIQLHKEWMIRSYVVTLAFIWFRVLADYTPLFSWLEEEPRYTALLWASWAIPLLITEIGLNFPKLTRGTAAGSSPA